MGKLMRILLLLVLVAFMAGTSSAIAAQLQLQTYDNAHVLFESTAQTDGYVFAIGSYKKVSGAWRLDRQQRLSGSLQRVTLELPEGHTAKNGFDFYLDQLQNFNLRELFYCKGRDCGTSNSWANNHFKILQLYGLDQFQYYGAYEVTTADEKPFYIALYAVQRGNKRVYLQLDILHIDKRVELGIASSPESIIKSINNGGYYVFPDLVVEDNEGKTRIGIKPAHLQALVEVLKQKTAWKIAIVGHDYMSVTLVEQQKKSLVYADQLKGALQKEGIATARMETYGLGGLAPVGRGDRSARVEIVLIND